MRSPRAERKEKTFLCFFLSEKHGFGRGRGEPHNCCCALRPAREIKVDIPPEPKHNRARCSQRCFYILYSMIFLVKILSPRRWWSRALRTTTFIITPLIFYFKYVIIVVDKMVM